MKNKLIHLNNHLFEQLERLNDADLKSEELQEEMSRAKAITGVANQIINNARLVFEATKALSEGLIRERAGQLHARYAQPGRSRQDQSR